MSKDINAFCSSLDELQASSFTTEADRARAKDAASRLLSRLETPFDTLWESIWDRPAMNAALKTCTDVGLFKKWSAAGGGPKSGAELANLTGVDATLLKRMMRHLGATHCLTVVGEDNYEMTPFTQLLSEEGPSRCFSNYWVDINAPGFLTLPAFLAETKYADPEDSTKTNWIKTHDGKNLFEFFGANPGVAMDFHHVMQVISASKPSLAEIYPADNLLSGWNKEAPLLVDVGGSGGHDIEKFRARLPGGLPDGSLVLQDLPEAIEKAQVQKPIKAEVYDFFGPQPIKGARAYYMHVVLHDWPDDKAVEILKNIGSAMMPGYSKVLIHENAISTRNPDRRTTALDLTMMFSLSAKERTAQMWDDVLKSAGMKLIKIWNTPTAHESVLEAELA